MQIANARLPLIDTPTLNSKRSNVFASQARVALGVLPIYSYSDAARRLQRTVRRPMRDRPCPSLVEHAEGDFLDAPCRLETSHGKCMRVPFAERQRPGWHTPRISKHYDGSSTLSSLVVQRLGNPK